MSKISRLLEMRKHPVVKSVGIYTVTNFLAKSTSFLLLFIFTNPKYITPAENGVLSLFNNALLFLKPVMTLGIIHSISADFFKLGKKDFKDSFTTGFILSAIVAVLSLLFFFIFRGYLHDQYGFSDLIIILIPVITFFIFCFEQLTNILRSSNKPMTFMKVNLGRLVIEMGLSVLLVVVFSWHWQGRIMGLLTSYLLLAVFAIFYFFKRDYLFGNVKKEYVKNEIAYAGPIIALQMAFFAVNSSDKFILSHFSTDGNKTVGIYSIAAIFASVVFTLHHALIQYVFPRIFSELAEKEINYASIRKHFIFYTMAMAGATLGLIFITPLIYHFFINSIYLPALDYFYLFCIGYFLWSVSYFFFAFLLFHKEKAKILLLSLSSIIVSIILNYFFISRWLAWGGAFSVCISCIFIFFLTISVTWKEARKVLFK